LKIITWLDMLQIVFLVKHVIVRYMNRYGYNMLSIVIELSINSILRSFKLLHCVNWPVCVAAVL